MLIFILAFLGGVLTLLSPCVLPVVPFIFSRSDQPFRKSGLPMLIGMMLSFASFAALSVTGARWVVQANQIGRVLALIVFAVLGLSLLFSRVADRLALPFVRLGDALQKRAERRIGLGSSLLLGASIGLLWAPCAGPILGLVLAGAALGHSSQRTFGLLLAFAMGAATSLGVAIFAGGKVLRTLKKGFVAEEWIKRALGITVLGAVIAIALGLDTKILAKLSYFNTNDLEQHLVDQASGNKSNSRSSTALSTPLSDEGPLPSLEGATLWLNSPPLSVESLRGKVVVIDFWTYSCINCLRTLPYLKEWEAKYHDQGLVIVGVHTPEFAFEKDLDHVKNAVRELGITYPIAIDSNQTIWATFKNQYWPAHYFVDAQGRIRYHHFGEGNYEESERVIQELLRESHGESQAPKANHSSNVPTMIQGTGVEAPASKGEIASPETYLGYNRQEGFVGTPEINRDRSENYQEPTELSLNQWGISGSWNISSEMATLKSPQGTLSFRFRARDLHLVIGAPAGKSVRYRVTLDGRPPAQDHGEDTDSEGNGMARAHRLYQLIRQKESDKEHTFRIEFFDPGVEVFAFTFG